jgi:predicted glycoside hydrolase/deacetylase ChbG (UPF0249 family)
MKTNPPATAMKNMPKLEAALHRRAKSSAAWAGRTLALLQHQSILATVRLLEEERAAQERRAKSGRTA